MKITIDRISLRNFKGIKALDVELGSRTAIYGRNATGKTTLFDAFLWALVGKDSLNSAAFEIKSLDARGNPAHNLEHSVDVVLNADGRPVTLRKVYAEKYTKKRGSASSEFTGHTTEYFFDGVPLKEKEYQDRIKGIIDEKVFRLLTDPRYFNEVMHWQDRRKVLMEVCGDVTTDEVIASDKSLAGLKSILNGHNIDDYKKMIASQKAKINDELKKIPVRIDEASRSMAEIRPDIDAVPGQIATLEQEKENLESQITDLRNGGAVSKKRIDLQEVEAEIRARKNASEEGKAARIEPLKKELGELQDSMSATRRKVRDLEDELQSKKSSLSIKEKARERLIQEWHASDSQAFDGATHCPVCKQALPEDKVSAARESFNHQKAEKLASIEAQGQEIKKDIEFLHSRISEIEKEIEEIKAANTGNTHEAEAKIREQIDVIRNEHIDLSDLEAKKASIQAEINNISGAEQGLVSEIQAKLFHIKADIGNLQGDLQKVAGNKAAEQRIEDLRVQEEALSRKFEELEGNLFLCENFIRSKVALLEDRINRKFSLARFKMFSDQINGGLSEVCETTMGGVPYSSVNNAGRIQAGMDIIRTLQQHYGITAPVWIDNRESIVDLPEMDGQVISLIVSEQDKVLRIETGYEPMKKAGGM